MDPKAFLKKLCELDICIVDIKYFHTIPRGTPQDLSHCISCQWVSGGVTGGNCWGGTANQPVSADSPTELTELDTILQEFCPDISYLQFRQLSQVIQETTRGDGGDYYGNYYEYTVRYIVLQDLYDKMVELKLI